MNELDKVSIVVPAFNEEEIIGRVVGQIREILDSCHFNYEVIVVDDGSQDNTCQAASRAGAKVFRHPYNIGNGASVKHGIRKAAGDVIVLMDGDGQHPPEDIPHLLQYMPEYDMVVGARTRESESELHRDLANKLYSLLASYVVGSKVPDLTSGFRVIKANIAKRIVYLFPNGYSYPSTCTVALFRSGYSVKYVPIRAAARVGKSKISLSRDGIGFLLILIRIGTLFAPLKIFLPLACFLFLPGFIYGTYLLVIGRTFSPPTVISVTGGLLIFVLGLISEQIALLRMEHAEE